MAYYPLKGKETQTVDPFASPDPFSLFMAGARHRAVRTVTTATRLALFVISDQLHDDGGHHRDQAKANQNRADIFCNPRKHDELLLYSDE